MLGLGLNIFTLAIRRYFGGGGGQFAGSSLNLDFTSGNRTLDPRITFSRASNATVTGPDGVLGYAPHNLLTFSEQFDGAAWSKTRSSISANTAVAPDGTTTADKLIEDSSAGASHPLVSTSMAIPVNVTAAFSIYAKAAERTALVLRLNSGADSIWGAFNLSTGAVGAVLNSGTGAGASVAIESVGGGWYRCTLSGLCSTTATSATAIAYPAVSTTDPANTSIIYTGDGVSGLFIWGAQLNVGPLQPYYPTSVKNLLGYTQEFDNAAWTKSNATVAANATTAPDGSLTADKLVEAATSCAHTIAQAATLSANTEYVLSAYLKADERAIVRLGGASVSNWAVFRPQADFNLAAGSVSNIVGNSAGIEPVGNGWYRCHLKATFGAASNTGGLLVIPLTSAGSTGIYPGDGTSGIYIWGAQLSDSASLDPYVYNPEAAPTAQAYYGPRFDYDPVTLAPRGLLIEEQRTNLLTFSEQMNGTDWGTPAGGTVVVDQSVAPDGTTTADHFTQTIAGNILRKTVPLTNGTLYTASVYVRSVSGNTTFVTDIGDVGTNVFTLTTQWQRISFSAIAGAIGHVDFRINGAGTFAIWGAQLEAGAFPTSYIPTTTAAATRAADVATMTGANFSNWYRQDEGTLFAEASTFETGSTSGGALVAQVTDGGSNNLHRVFRQSDAQPVMQTLVGGAAQTTFGFGANWTDTQPRRLAYAYKANDFAGTVNAATVQTDGAGAVPAVTQMDIGSGGVTTQINGHIRRISYFPRRLSNSELEGITK